MLTKRGTWVGGRSQDGDRMEKRICIESCVFYVCVLV